MNSVVLKCKKLLTHLLRHLITIVTGNPRPLRRVHRLQDRLGNNVKWLLLVPAAAVVVAWGLFASILLFTFPDQSRDEHYPESRAAFDQQYRSSNWHTNALKVLVIALLGIFLAVLAGRLAGLVTNKEALLLGGWDMALLSLLLLATLRPWKWTFYSAPAKES